MTNRQGDVAYADRVIQAAMQAATGGLDADRVAEVVAKVVEAIDKQAAALKAATYRPEDYERIARAMAHGGRTAGRTRRPTGCAGSLTSSGGPCRAG
jgi:hypothetical protein